MFIGTAGKERRLRDLAILNAMADTAFREEVERLASASVRKARLSPPLYGIWREVSWHRRASVARGWLGMITLVDLFVIPIDALMSDKLLLPGLLLRGLAIPLVYAVAVRAWTSPRSPHVEATSIILFSGCMMALALTLGMIAGGDVHERYVAACFMVVSTGVAIVPLDARWCLMFGLCNCLAYAGAEMLNAAVNGLTVDLMTLFFSAVTLPLVISRTITDRLQRRMVMMHFRNVHQVEELRKANLQLQEFATTDALTGLLNRRSIMERLHAPFATAADAPRMSLALIDVDHFKRINDTLGHPEGDRCLQAIALSLQTRAVDARGLVGRYGGEEFLLVLPDTGIGEALAICETIRLAVQRLDLRNSDAPATGCVTVSIGVSSTACGLPGAVSPTGLLQAADEALYRAKTEGRNSVRSFSTVRAQPAAAPHIPPIVVLA